MKKIKWCCIWVSSLSLSNLSLIEITVLYLRWSICSETLSLLLLQPVLGQFARDYSLINTKQTDTTYSWDWNGLKYAPLIGSARKATGCSGCKMCVLLMCTLEVDHLKIYTQVHNFCLFCIDQSIKLAGDCVMCLPGHVSLLAA